MNATPPLTLSAALICFAISPALAQLSVPRFVVASGGATRSSGGSFGIGGTIGQAGATTSTGGLYVVSTGFWFGGNATSGIGDDPGSGEPDVPGAQPLAFEILPVTPNPVAEVTTLAFQLPEARHVRIEVYDASGRMVRSVADESVAAGRSQGVWDRRDQTGVLVPGGVYFMRMSALPDERTQKVVVLP
ncbi:MAG: T9SS type A sorting domain-containing protein [Candidatus Eisenbacteria bacterium]|nr:T9SS type A sorting domain-containing protein [Candidatus Eisenbacteria bacterium]